MYGVEWGTVYVLTQASFGGRINTKITLEWAHLQFLHGLMAELACNTLHVEDFFFYDPPELSRQPHCIHQIWEYLPYTVRYSCNTVNFLQSCHISLPTARAMVCFISVQSLVYVLLMQVLCCIQYCFISNRILRKPTLCDWTRLSLYKGVHPTGINNNVMLLRRNW